MTTKKEPPKESVPVITGSGLEVARQRRSKKKIISLILVLVAVVLIGLVIAMILRSDKKPSAKSKAQETAPPISQNEEAGDKQIATNLALSGNFEAALNVLQPKLDKATTPEEKASILNDIGLVANNANKPDVAIDYATQSNQIKESGRSWGIIGTAYVQQENWKAADDAFGRAAELSPSAGSDGVRSDKNNYLELQTYARSKV